LTLNDVYGVVPIDNALVEPGHKVRGDILLEIVHEMCNGNGTGTRDTAVGVAVANNNIRQPPYGIQNQSLYALHTLATEAEALGSVMIKFNVPLAISTVHSSKSKMTQQPLRSLWIDFIKSEWPYDGNDCQCLQDEEFECPRGNGAKDPAIATTSTMNGNGGGGKSESPPGTTHNAQDDHHAPHLSNTTLATNGRSHGRKRGAEHHGSGPNLVALSAVIIVGAAILSITLRRARRRQDPRAAVVERQSELEGSHDLELQESTVAANAYGASTGSCYSSPAVPAGGTYV